MLYRRKLVQKGLGKVIVAAARKLGIRLWVLLRDPPPGTAGSSQNSSCSGMTGHMIGGNTEGMK